MVFSGARFQRYFAEPHIERDVCHGILRNLLPGLCGERMEGKAICRDWKGSRYGCAAEFMVPCSFPLLLFSRITGNRTFAVERLF